MVVEEPGVKVLIRRLVDLLRQMARQSLASSMEALSGA